MELIKHIFTIQDLDTSLSFLTSKKTDKTELPKQFQIIINWSYVLMGAVKTLPLWLHKIFKLLNHCGSDTDSAKDYLTSLPPITSY